jgi:sulfur-oxidizing protein SoxX
MRNNGTMTALRCRVPSATAWAVALAHAAAPVPAQAQSAASVVQPYTVVGDAIPAPLSAVPGDAARGRAIVVNRQVGLCLLCHAGPFPEERFQGTLAPDLAGAGTRWSEGQLRLRLVDSRRLNPQSLMPAYHRTEHLTRVGSAWHERPVLNAQQIEDVVALLRTLRD